LSNDEVIHLIARNCVPVALLVDYDPPKTAVGDYWRSIYRQGLEKRSVQQGVYLATADGKLLSCCAPGRKSNGEHDESAAGRNWNAIWTRQVREALEEGLKAFGTVKPREGKTGEVLASDGIGVRPDGSVSLFCCTRYMTAGLKADGIGEPIIESIKLTAKEWAALAPAKIEAGAQWQIPDAVARKFNSVLGPSCNDSLPTPDEVTTVRFTGKVESVQSGIAYLSFRGQIAGKHKSGSHGVEYQSEATLLGGVAAYDVRGKTMLSLTMVFDCGRHDSQYYLPSGPPQKFGAVVDWRRERADQRKAE
jgi:hypothetical protein